MAKKSQSKVDQQLASLSREESDRIGREVERLMKDEMSFIVRKYVISYRNACADIFGWEEEDLVQHIRIILWRGVATYKSNKNAKMTTYLSAILYYRMANLNKKIKREKHQKSRLFCPEDFYDREETTDFDSPEDWLRYAQQFNILMKRMTKLEEKVLVCHLLKDMTLSEVQEKLKIRRPVLISALKSLKGKMAEHIGGKDEKTRLH